MRFPNFLDLLVVRSRTLDEDAVGRAVDAVHEAMLDVDPPRIEPLQFTDQFLVRRGKRERIGFQQVQQRVGLLPQARSFQLLRILPRGGAEVDMSFHQGRFFE